MTVIARLNQPERGYVVYEDTRRAAAGRRLDRTLSTLREEGIAGARPRRRDAIRSRPCATHSPSSSRRSTRSSSRRIPTQKSGWLRKNVIDGIRDVAGGDPVEHVVVDVREEDGQQNVLVIANETVIGEQLLDKIRERAAQGAASFF